MKRWVAAAIGAGLIVAAWGVAAVTPTDDDIVSPFVVSAQIGQPAIGRDIAVTVHDVHRANSAAAGEWSAEGNWLVVDLDAEAVVSEAAARFEFATFEIDGSTFRASERPESIFGTNLSVGIPRSGSIAFELPESADDGIGMLRLGLAPDTRLDSMIVLAVDLSTVDVDSRVELDATDWSAP